MTDRKRGWKKAIQDRARTILNAAQFGVPIVGPDSVFLRELIAIHPEAESKIGVGIDYFEVRTNEWKGRTFWLIRIDGTATDFSFLKALTKPSPMQDFAKACRVAVVHQVLAFKHAEFSKADMRPTCPFTGEALTWDTAHVDHAVPTFDQIVQAFAELRDDIIADVRPTADGELLTQFADPATAQLFADFHERRASLRLVSRRANLSILKRAAPPPPSSTAVGAAVGESNVGLSGS